MEAVEHGFDWDKSVIYVIERSVWRFAEPGGIVADAGRAVLGYARVFDAGVGEWMNERTKERMVVLANVLRLPPSHICDMLAITGTPYMVILNYDLGQCAIALSRLENVLLRILEHLTYQEPNLTT